MRKALPKIEKTPELVAYYKKVADWCKTNNVPFKKLSPLGLCIDVRDIPKDKIDSWIEIVSKN